MPKRKRNATELRAEPDAARHSSKHGNNTKRARPDERIHHGHKALLRALKIAKGFERQKLGRRRKTAVQTQNDGDVARLDAEIDALKTLDLNSAAEAHLYKTMLKEKAIYTSPLLPSYVKADTKLAQDTATANVTARLYNSNPVKEALAEVLPLIRTALGIRTSVTSSTERLKTNNTGAPDRRRGIQKALDADDVTQSTDSNEDYQVESWDSAQDSDVEPVPTTAQLRNISPSRDISNDDDESFDEAMDARIASQSDEDVSSDFEAPWDRSAAGDSASHPAIDLSLSPSLSPSRSPSPPPVSKQKSSHTNPAPPANATYLPSLTMGGYWSGGDSASESAEDLDEVAPRKNRRGQRARQKIWEKKFGKGAKHLQDGARSKHDSGKGGRDQGWDLKRGAQLESGGPRKGGHQPRRRQPVENVASGGNATKLAKRPVRADVADAKPLHPSWEAARRAKEQRQTGSFEGKKVVFE